VQTTAQSGDSRKVQNFCSKSHWVAQASAWRLAGEAEAAAVRAGVSWWAGLGDASRKPVQKPVWRVRTERQCALTSNRNEGGEAHGE
jgi:hypothetical protein